MTARKRRIPFAFPETAVHVPVRRRPLWNLFRRREPTTYHKVVAIHIYEARWQKSALS